VTEDVRGQPGAATWLRDGRDGRWAHAAAVATWMICGLPPFVRSAEGTFGGWPAFGFAAAFAVYGLALVPVLYPPRRLTTRLVYVLLVGIQTIAGLAMIAISGLYLRGSGATPATLVIVAAELPHLLPIRWVWLWVVANTVGLTVVVGWVVDGWADVITFPLAMAGFQAFAVTSSYLALREARARARLAVANTELQAAQALLAETSRTEERLRISRDLHDTLGHHLTALSLQLDVASRLADGKSAEHVQQAHAITRLLLSDVRDVVGTLRETGPVDLAPAIRALTDGSHGVSIHLDLPAALPVADSARADALLRCVQEVITNAARHAQAHNLWIRLDPRPDGIALDAHDDGHGAASLSLGHGLTGMRERFAAFAGSVEFETRPDAGFQVRGFMPTSHGAA
jgi:signal transduction histidine kinase